MCSAPVFYKGVRVGPGSALYHALERGDQQAASKIHAEAMADFRDQNPKCTDVWFELINAPTLIECDGCNGNGSLPDDCGETVCGVCSGSGYFKWRHP